MSDVLYSPDQTIVMLPRAAFRIRSKARYEGYKLLNYECGIGAFYPDEFAIRVAWLRPEDDDMGEFSHVVCAKDAPGAIEFWAVEYVEKLHEYRDGRWRTVPKDAA